MTAPEVLKQLEQMGSAQTKKTFLRHGCPEPFFGVKIGDMKTLVKKIKRDSTLAKELSKTGNPDAQYFAGLIADELAIGVVNNKTTAARLIPVPGKKAGEVANWGGLFGHSAILDVQNLRADETLVSRGGRVPAPIQSLRN